ncbi:hypothetical protein [Nocardiopsis suaedae]|uniref:Uncharacterized protein n=1 Tax=Nocardiopsis suaedae TaxID=3018444 RepID=A0ABT4TK19_9ACTN|nr:hypothetical protein [Nocardiopsis suaedae]MDA2805005.1 hypothetical protein [Nocardiopsis suaedae]
MARLSRSLFPVLPEDGVFRIYGQGARPDPSGTPAPPGGELLACGVDHMELRTLQGRVPVGVTVEEWDGPPRSDAPGAEGPEAPEDAEEGGPWEERALGSLLLHGQISVRGGVNGSAVRIRLAGGSGRYAAEVRARHRRAVAEDCVRLLRRHPDPRCEGFLRAARMLGGREAFLIRLWPLSAAADQRSSRAVAVRYPTVVSG